MILEVLFNLILSLLKLILNLIPPLPQVQIITNLLTFFNNTICKGISLLGVFIRPTTIITGLSIAAALFVFRYTSKFFLWVAKKIPFLNIK